MYSTFSAVTDSGWFSWPKKFSRPFSGSHSKFDLKSHLILTGEEGNGFGDMGLPVQLPASLQVQAQASFSKNQFNLVVSDLIGLRRKLPNYRPLMCPNISVTDSLIAWKTSIIIVFHNEAWSTLLRTVISVIDRTPHALLEEIILVDDASTSEELGTPLDDYVAGLSVSCHVERMGERSGLVRARLRGSQRATGKTLTFLDAHCEATEGWLEPLLEQVAQDPHHVVCPIIDVISDETFAYTQGSHMIWGTFDWQLSFHWNFISEAEKIRTREDPRIPTRTPIMAGGLFTISRDYFYEMGSYDPGMVVWGVENVEMSLRIWQCGGELLILPCSHVGHVFRKTTPHEWPGGILNVLAINSLRTAHVWMDDYVEFYLNANPYAKMVEYGDVSDRIALRKKLNCKNFKWYLDNVFTHHSYPSSYFGLGEIRHTSTSMCLDTMGKKINNPVGVVPCHGLRGNQAFAWTPTGEIWSNIGCLQWIKEGFNFGVCDSDDVQSRTFDYVDEKLILRSKQLCLLVEMHDSTAQLNLNTCKDEPKFHWKLPVTS